MKKLLLTAAAILATLNMYGQGVINFQNIGGTTADLIYVDTYLTGARAPAGGTYKIALYAAPNGLTSDDPSGFVITPSSTGTSHNMGPTAGSFSGGNKTVPTSGGPGGQAVLQVRCWTTAYGLTYDEALNNALGGDQGRNKVGVSGVFVVPVTGNPPFSSPTALLSTAFDGFAITTVPEPSVIGLGLLGVGTLLMLRRRK